MAFPHAKIYLAILLSLLILVQQASIITWRGIPSILPKGWNTATYINMITPRPTARTQGNHRNATSNTLHLVCVGITLRPTRENLKWLAYYNTMTMYANLSESVQAFLLVISPTNKSLAKLSNAMAADIWTNTGHNPRNILNNTMTNAHGTPYLSSIVEQIELACPAHVPFVAYVNADILFDSGLILTLNAVHTWMNLEYRASSFDWPILEQRKRVMITGMRSNHDLQGIIRPQTISDSTRKLDIPYAQDYFIMSRNLVNWTTLPNFVVGRIAYDNALVDWAYHNAYLIDATQTILALHQSTADGNRAWSQNPDKDVAFNTEQEGVVYDHGSTNNAHALTRWTMTTQSWGSINTQTETQHVVEVHHKVQV
jgi:hypothetical protein